MRHKRGRCACLAFWVKTDDSLLPEDVLPDACGVGVEMSTMTLPGGPRLGRSIRPHVQREEDPNGDLWRETLRHLEIMRECDAASEAGFDSGDERSDPGGDEAASASAGSAARPRLTEGPEDFEHVPTRISQRRGSDADNVPSNAASFVTAGDGPRLSTLELKDMLQRLRLRELPEPAKAAQLFEEVRDHLHESCKTLMYLPKPAGRLIVVGDLHGHFNDLLRLLDTYGEPSEEARYLFNGDFVDRGIWGPEVVLFLFCLRLLYPQAVFLNRGNHETKFCTDRYGFQADLQHAFPKDHEMLYERVLEAFDQLPLAYIVGEAIFVVHGGLPAHFVSRKDIERLRRGPFPMQGRTAKVRTFQALLWSDPKEQAGNSSRGMGFHFNRDMTEEFLQGNGNLRCIIRSHECVAGGFGSSHGGLVKTVFSASNYDANNDASVAIIGSDMQVSQGSKWNEPYVQENWIREGLEDPSLARSGWRGAADSDRRAIAALASRLGSERRWRCSARQRALEEICGMIFLCRPSLLEKFEASDRQTGNQDGKVTVQQWEEIMALCLKTPPEFPWRQVGPYLYHVEPGGSIAYMDFLVRFDSPFSAWLGNQWCKATLDQIANKVSAFNDLFDELDSRGDKALPYSSMRALLYKALDMRQPKDSTEASNEAVHVYVLFRTMDRNRSGRVTRNEFVGTLKRHRAQGMSAHLCRSGHPLRTCRLKAWQGCVKVRVCDRCFTDIDRSEPILTCDRCQYDLCTGCVQQLRVGALQTVVEVQRAEKTMRAVQAHWDVVEQALRAVFNSHTDIYSLFTLVDKNGDGLVHHGSFVKVLSRALRRDPQTMEQLYGMLCRYILEQRKKEPGFTGPMKVKELAESLAVRDRGEEAEELGW